MLGYILGFKLWLYGDNGKENANYYNGLYILEYVLHICCLLMLRIVLLVYYPSLVSFSFVTLVLSL